MEISTHNIVFMLSLIQTKQ